MAAIRTIAILGPGLLGGSLAWALHRLPTKPHVIVWARRKEAAQQVTERGLASGATTDLAEAVRAADEVILCTPFGAMVELVKAARPHLRPGVFLTDVASVKAPVDEAIAPVLAGHAHWIGSHPMAGGEKAGLDAARPDLFHGARVILTPTKATSPLALKWAEQFWSELGAACLKTTPQNHDWAVAQISHLPHLVAVLLALAPENEALLFAGPGFRDTTRVAGGPPSMWTEILLANRSAVLDALNTFEGALIAARIALQTGDEKRLQELLTAANDVRRLFTDAA